MVLMPRQKLSEHKAKSIIAHSLNLPYQGWSITAGQPLEDQLPSLQLPERLVLKVDEGVKGRFKKGLVALNVATDQLPSEIDKLKAKGYKSFIIEPMLDHGSDQERYLSLSANRSGLTLSYTASGGVDVEAHADQIKSVNLSGEVDWQTLAAETGVSAENLQKLKTVFTDNYFVFLEINPYVVKDDSLFILDAAVEVDDAGEYFVNSWTAADFRRHSDQGLTPQEAAVQELNANSPAAFTLNLLQPDGSVWLLLSGGGASVVVADEVYNRGLGQQLANYGEYSGNPGREETYLYTKALLELLLKSAAPKKVLFVGGAVANFTDIAQTFSGVIQALDELADQLKAQGTKVFVRRGGPNQEKGLSLMKSALEKHELLGAVHDPSTALTGAVDEALGEL
jgi:succinyl-CoA synthetase beta subunit